MGWPVAAYLPWINGLVEGANKILLYILARLCAPEVRWQTTNWEDLPRTWPDHFDEAIQILNWQILPGFKFSPKELLLSPIVNTTPTPLKVSSSMPQAQDFNMHMATKARWLCRGSTAHHGLQNQIRSMSFGFCRRGGHI
jgi:hypothetical protein